MESLVTWFATTLGPYISEKAVVFMIYLITHKEHTRGQHYT